MPGKRAVLSFRTWGLTALCPVIAAPLASAQGRNAAANQPPAGPWMNKDLAPDQRADMVIEQMTLDEKIQLAYGGRRFGPPFAVKNTGKRAGAETAEVFAALPAATGEPPKRLVGWEKIQLMPGESRTVTVAVEPLFLSTFNVDKDDWQLTPEAYKMLVGGSSKNLPLTYDVRIPD
jgi:hypothetical protein